MAPKSSKLSQWSGIWSSTEPIQRTFLWEAFKIPETKCVSQKLESPQHVLPLLDYNWFCEGCSWLLSDSAHRFIPNTITSACLPPACIPRAAHLSSFLTLLNTAQALHNSQLPRPECVAEALLNTHMKGTPLLLLGHLVTVALFPFLLLSNSVCTEKYNHRVIFF